MIQSAGRAGWPSGLTRLLPKQLVAGRTPHYQHLPVGWRRLCCCWCVAFTVRPADLHNHNTLCEVPSTVWLCNMRNKHTLGIVIMHAVLCTCIQACKRACLRVALCGLRSFCCSTTTACVLQVHGNSLSPMRISWSQATAVDSSQLHVSSLSHTTPSPDP
jgi:hypothetical protein